MLTKCQLFGLQTPLLMSSLTRVSFTHSFQQNVLRPC